MRLDKFISYTMDISRSDAKKVIKSDGILVNGKTIYNPNFIVDYKNDLIIKDDVKLIYEKYIYLMMNKPKGYLSATQDREKTVLDLVDEYKKYNLVIAGRLDIDSEGLILLTNDGALVHTLTSPKSNIYKKYYVEVEGSFEEKDIYLFEEGFEIRDGNDELFKTAPAILEIISINKAYISIKEGKFHQVKRMCEKLDKEVTYLKRLEIGNLVLDKDLRLGEYRKLSNLEIDLIKNTHK